MSGTVLPNRAANALESNGLLRRPASGHDESNCRLKGAFIKNFDRASRTSLYHWSVVET
jgi:hypothetical protein